MPQSLELYLWKGTVKMPMLKLKGREIQLGKWMSPQVLSTHPEFLLCTVLGGKVSVPGTY